MDLPEGRILSIDTTTRPPCAVIEVTSAIQCARCAAGKGCGAGIVAGGGRRRIDAVLAANLTVQAGDRVTVELAPDNLLRAATIVYGLPLTGALVGAAGAYLAGFGEPGAAFAVLAGIAAGALVGRLRLQQAACLRRFVPTVTARAREEAEA
ncbi:MAG: SoxR reducing system RseC family protein [Woeseiaceae bacterium]